MARRAPALEKLRENAGFAHGVAAKRAHIFIAETMKILIVEDAPDMREIVADTLSGGNFEVRAVATGAGGLAMLKSWAPHVVICDLGLPDLPGEEVARIAAALSPRPRMVMMSADAKRIEAMRLVADAVFHKPFHLDHMTSVVEMFHRRYLREQFEEKR